MSYLYAGTIRSGSGMALANKGLTVYTNAAGTTPASLMDSLGVAIANPTTTDDRGRVEVYCTAANLWYKITGDARVMRLVRFCDLTQNDVNGPYANPMDFGAVGDGSHDDTAAIQAAVDAAKNVYFPPPPVAYLITSTITGEDMVLRGHGRDAYHNKVVCNTEGVKAFHFTGVTASMQFMTIQGGSMTPGYSPAKLVQIGDGVNWMSDGFFGFNWLTGNPHNALQMDLCQGFTVMGNVFDGLEGTNIKLNGACNLRLIGNRIYLGGETGVSIDWVDETAAPNYDILIADNLIDEVAGYNSPHNPAFTGMTSENAGIWAGYANGLVINSNHFAHNYRGVSLDGSGSNVVRDVSMNGNTFSGQLAESVLINEVNRVTMNGNNFVPFTALGTVTELAECAHVETVGACSRIVVTGGSMVGNVSRTTGVHFSAGTTLSAVDMLMHEGLDDAVVDDGSNTLGTLIG